MSNSKPELPKIPLLNDSYLEFQPVENPKGEEEIVLKIVIPDKTMIYLGLDRSALSEMEMQIADIFAHYL